MKKQISISLVLLILFPNILFAQDDVDLFSYWKYYSDVENVLYKHFCNVAFEQLDARKENIKKLKTKEDWLVRQAVVRKKLSEVIGPFPDHTPLNAQITGTLDRGDYRIELLLYESSPGYYVDGAIYIPKDLEEKAPAVFYACGHSVEGFKVGIYQHIIINLVKKGFIVLTIDPMGQGERYQYWDSKAKKLKFPIPDHEHSYAGAQCMISGYSTGRHFLWDMIRGVDYLITRNEVDPARIGVTGRSGGGNLSAYLGAVDDRIAAAAPECYITGYEYIYKSIGPQCAEQNLYGMIGAGLDHADFIEVRAPKPTMIIGTTRDFFSMQGTRESYKEAKSMYEAFGAGELLTLVTDDTVHKSTKNNREAMYAFFQKYLDNPGNPEDMEVEIPKPELLQVTSSGQIVESLGGESVFSLNRKIVEKQVLALREVRNNPDEHLKELPSKVAQLSGFKYPQKFGHGVFSGRYVNSEYILEKYLIPGNGDYMLPAVLLKSKKTTSGSFVLLLDSEGMENAANKDSLAHELVHNGHSVLIMDFPGIGSMGPGYMKGDSYIENISYGQWTSASLVGKSFVALRAEDIIRAVHFIRSELENPSSFSVIARGPLGSEILHAAVFEPYIRNVILINPFLSYADIATTRFYKPAFIPYVVAGAIQAYDLPDLMAHLSPGKLMIVDPLTADGSVATKDDLILSYTFPEEVMNSSETGKRFIIHQTDSNKVVVKLILDWLK